MRKNPLWYKFIECDCAAEGVMLSTEDCLTDDPKTNGQRQIYLAFFQNGWNGKELTFKQKLRWIWQILTEGVPFGDTVILNVGNALLLKHYLNRFIIGSWPRAYKEVKKAKAVKKVKTVIEAPIEGLYRTERAL